MDISEFKNEEEYVSQASTGALLNPRMDSTFKALFTQNTKESHDALHAFLEAATERKIKSFELRANDAPAGFGGQRGVSYGFPTGSQRLSAQQKVVCNAECSVTCA